MAAISRSASIRNCPAFFSVLPRMPYGVRAIPADRAGTAAPYYEGPAMDGSRAGNFYLRTADPKRSRSAAWRRLFCMKPFQAITCKSRWPREMSECPGVPRNSFHARVRRGLGIVRRIARDQT